MMCITNIPCVMTWKGRRKTKATYKAAKERYETFSKTNEVLLEVTPADGYNEVLKTASIKMD